ncbi:MAG: hypothetical protein ACRDT6_17290, partial [Micromonosporaceae bacterium]
MTATLRRAGTLADILHRRAQDAPEQLALTALGSDGEPAARLTAAGLDLAARTLAAELLAVAAPGDRVLLPAMPGLRFQVGFLACLYAGLIAVPAPAIGTAAPGSGRPRRFSRLVGLCR